MVRWTEQGFEYEADLRHADILIGSLGLSEAKGVKSPGEVDKAWEVDETEVLDKAEAARFRAMAVWGNFLAMDRMDIQCAAKG